MPSGPTRFEARVAELAPEGYQLDLVMRGSPHRGQRTVRLASCAEVEEAAALLIATALDPALALREDDAVSEPADVPRAAPRRRPSVSLGVRGLLDTRSLPDASGGIGAGLQLSFEHLWLWADARYFFPARARDTQLESETAIDLIAGALGVALTWSLGALSLGPALEAEAGMLRGKTSGVEQPERAQVLWVSGLGGALASYTLHERVSVSLTMLGGAPFVRPRFALRDEEPFYATRAWTFRLALGVRVSLGSR